MAGRFDSLIVASAAAIFKQHCPGFYGKMQDKPIRKSEAAKLLGAMQQLHRLVCWKICWKTSKTRDLQKIEKILEIIEISRIFLELLGRFELPTSSLPMTRSTD